MQTDKERIEEILSLDPDINRRLDIVTLEGVPFCTHCYQEIETTYE